MEAEAEAATIIAEAKEEATRIIGASRSAAQAATDKAKLDLRNEADGIVAEAVAKAKTEAEETIAAAREKAETEIRPSEEALKQAADAVFNAVAGGGR